jgi:hypothetical protein
MKKTLVTMLAAVALTATSFGQGTINFLNTASTLVTIDGVAATSGQGAKVELLWAPLGTTDLGLFQLVEPSTSVSVGVPLAGRFSGGVRTVPGIAAGGIVNIIVRGYVGVDFAAANVRGTTPILQIDTGDPTSAPAGTPTLVTAPGGFTGLNLTVVPEPSSMALAGLGAAALVLFRRRK